MFGLWRRPLLFVLGSTIGAVPAAAQQRDVGFAGPYAGVEAGAQEHHFYIEETTASGTTGRYYRAWGVGGGAFAGYDWAVAPRVRLGVEAGVSVGGDNPEANFASGGYYSQHPQWGYRATGRVGYVLAKRLLAYGTFGYGGHKYRIENRANVADTHAWGSSFTIGAGFEYRLSDRAGVRLDFRHLDNQTSHIMVGVPIRF